MFINETRLKCIIRDVLDNVMKEESKRSSDGGASAGFQWVSSRRVIELEQMKEQLHRENNRFLDMLKEQSRNLDALRKERDELQVDLAAAKTRIESLRALVHKE